MPQYYRHLPLRAPHKLLNAHHFLAVSLGCYPEQAKPTPESFLIRRREHVIFAAFEYGPFGAAAQKLN